MSGRGGGSNRFSAAGKAAQLAKLGEGVKATHLAGGTIGGGFAPACEVLPAKIVSVDASGAPIGALYTVQFLSGISRAAAIGGTPSPGRTMSGVAQFAVDATLAAGDVVLVCIRPGREQPFIVSAAPSEFVVRQTEWHDMAAAVWGESGQGYETQVWQKYVIGGSGGGLNDGAYMIFDPSTGEAAAFFCPIDQRPGTIVDRIRIACLNLSSTTPIVVDIWRQLIDPDGNAPDMEVVVSGALSINGPMSEWAAYTSSVFGTPVTIAAGYQYVIAITANPPSSPGVDENFRVSAVGYETTKRYL